MKFFIVFSFVCYLLIGNAIAALPDKEIVLKNIEDQLNKIKTMNVNLVQTTEGENELYGKLLVAKPNRMRLTYDEKDLLLIADGYDLIFYQADLDQISYVGIKDTPAYLILSENFSFKADFIEIIDVWQYESEIYVTLTMKEDPLSGKITLFFEDKSFNIKGWTMQDARGVQTKVWFLNAKYNEPMDNDLFVFDESIRPNKRK